MKVVPHEGYVSYDMEGSNAWVRIFCVQMPDKSCGLLLAQHHTEDTSPVFDHRTELNLGAVSAGSHDHAMQIINHKTSSSSYNPAIVRRLARLMTHGALVEHFKDTLAERGLERLIVYGDRMSSNSYSVCDRAGFRKERRGDVECRILDLV